MLRDLITDKKNSLIFFIKVFVTVLIIVSLSFLIYKKNHYLKQVKSATNKVVEVINITTQDFSKSITLLGNIHSKFTTLIKANSSGTFKILKRTGTTVTRGTLIAKIENIDLDKSLQLSQNNQDLAQKHYQRLLTLFKSGYVSIKEVEVQKQIWLVAQKELSNTKMLMENLHFYAPFNGIIGAYKKRDGAQINQNESLVSIYDPTSLVVDFEIPCTNFSNIQVGQSVSILNKNYKLTHIQRMLDEETHMCPADVDIYCENCLIGNAIKVDLVVASVQNAIIVPSQAIFLRQAKQHVYIIENSKVKLVAVNTGLEQMLKTEIIDGLKVSQKLVINNPQRLQEGMKVDVKYLTHNLNIS